MAIEHPTTSSTKAMQEELKLWLLLLQMEDPSSLVTQEQSDERSRFKLVQVQCHPKDDTIRSLLDRAVTGNHLVAVSSNNDNNDITDPNYFSSLCDFAGNNLHESCLISEVCSNGDLLVAIPSHSASFINDVYKKANKIVPALRYNKQIKSNGIIDAVSIDAAVQKWRKQTKATSALGGRNKIHKDSFLRSASHATKATVATKFGSDDYNDTYDHNDDDGDSDYSSSNKSSSRNNKCGAGRKTFTRSNVLNSVLFLGTFLIGCFVGYIPMLLELINADVCNPALEDDNPKNTHLPPTEGLSISKIAFGSCFNQNKDNLGPELWQHFRENFGHDNNTNNAHSSSIWNWLGDSMYEDTNDSQKKRRSYNAVRADEYYSQYGPVAYPKIPTTGIWDDHDYAINNYGSNYQCRHTSQNEFVYHFNIPKGDPRHPCYDGTDGQREGVYSSYMFQKPHNDNTHILDSDTASGGIHLINLDARYHRSSTFPSDGPCKGSQSTILGETQWAWLRNELLNRRSDIKIIASGYPVLPPTVSATRQRHSTFCAYDGVNNTFDHANMDMNEYGPLFKGGTIHESWGAIPQERTRLLKLVQESVNSGYAKQIVFTTGDQHVAEIMHKEIPARTIDDDDDDDVDEKKPQHFQPAVPVYEICSSGINQNRWSDQPNTNRLHPDKIMELFGYSNTDATTEEEVVELMDGRGTTTKRTIAYNITATTTTTNNITKSVAEKEATTAVGKIKSVSYTSGLNICLNNAFYVCSAKGNYGGIEVDWEKEELYLSIYTPHEKNVALKEAAKVTIGF